MSASSTRRQSRTRRPSLREAPAEPTVEHTVGRLVAALDDPAAIDNPSLQAILAAAVRLYAARAEKGDIELPVAEDSITATDAMIAVTGMLDAVNVQLFEVGMWQAFTGACIPRRHRIDRMG